MSEATIKKRKAFKMPVYFSFCIALLISCFTVSAQQQRIYQQHEVIEIGNGTKIEILKCRGEGEDQECDVIYYTDKRQNGTRKWEKTSVIRQLEQATKAVLQPETQQPKKTSKVTVGDKKQLAKIPAIKTPAISDTSKMPKTNYAEKEVASNRKTSNPSITLTETIQKPSVDSTTNMVSPSIPVEQSTNVNISHATYTLDDCYRIAIDRNTTLKRAQNTINSNIIDGQSAKFGMYPSVSYNIGHYFSFGKNIDPVTNTYVFETFSGGYTALGLQMNLFSGFNRLNTIKQTSYIIQSSEYVKKRLELELMANITLVYARLLLDKEQLKAARSNIENTLNEIDVINEKIKVGRLTKYEFYTFNARLNTQQADLVTIQNDSSAALQDLRQLLNVPYKQQVDIISIDPTVLTDLFATSISASDFIDAILAKHPSIKQAQMDEQVAELGVKIAKSNAYPSVSIGGNISSNYNINQVNANGDKIALSNQLSNNLGQNINIGLHVPIFSQMETANRIKKEKININNAELAKTDAINAITASTLQLINDFNAAKQKYKASFSAWEQNSLSYNMYQEKYRLGQLSSVELITAADILNTSTSKYLQAKLEMFFRFKLLELLKSE
jgi:outer membrane protein